MTGGVGMNPYVGPRAFYEGEGPRFFGRDRELKELFHLLLARRLVLFYSPSGAGKSSLVRAKLIPLLRSEGFVVHPVIRVGAGAAAALGANRFCAATLLSLDEGRPQGERLSTADLAMVRLRDYLDRSADPAGAEEVVIFDQFEEVLSVDPTDRAAKEHFFKELGEALDNPRRWALFMLREDYLGALKPLLLPIPTRLAATYRLDLLDPTQARQAIQGPAHAAGGSIGDDAAIQLTDDLRQTTIQQPDGRPLVVLGPAIEPVQLQVVCYRLWERTFAAAGTAPTIGSHDLEAAGDVDTALQSYFADRVAAIAESTGEGQRQIRDWVEARLITESGLRGQVLRGAQGTTAGLGNQAVQHLVDAHLVRADERRGATWYELAHDRLLAPVLADNARWRDANLTPLQHQAALWDRQRRPGGLLLSGEALRQIQGDPAGLTEIERDFLTRSREAHAATLREQRQRRLRLITWIASLVGIGALALAAFAGWQSRLAMQNAALAEARAKEANTAEAEAQANEQEAKTAQANADAAQKVAYTQALLIQAQSALQRDPEYSLLVALYAIDHGGAPDQTVDALRETLGAFPLSSELVSGTGTVNWLAFSADGSRLASAGDDGVARVWTIEPADSPAGLAIFPMFAAAQGRVVSGALSPSGGLLVTVGDDGAAVVWDVLSSTALFTIPDDLGQIKAAAFSPDGRSILVGAMGRTARLYDIATNEWGASFSGHGNGVRRVAFADDGKRILTVAGDDVVRLFATDTGQLVSSLSGLGGPLAAATLMPNGRQVLTVSEDGTVRRFDADTGQQILPITGDGGPLTGAALSPNGVAVAMASADGMARVWDVEADSVLLTLPAKAGAVSSVAWSPDERMLATADSSGAIRLWQLPLMRIVDAREAEKDAVAISPGGQTMVVGRAPGATELWSDASGERVARPLASTAPISRSLFSQDSRTLLTLDTSGGVQIWDVASTRQRAALAVKAGTVQTATLSADGALVATLNADGAIGLWDAQTGDQLHRLREQGSPLTVAAFSNDGRRLATADSTGALQVWDLASGSPRLEPKEHTGPINALAWRHDDQRLATVSDDGTARIWDMGTGARDGLPLEVQAGALPSIAGSPDGRAGALTSVAWSPDGLAVATGGADGTVRIWSQAQDGAEGQGWRSLFVLRHPAGSVERVVFQSQGSLLLTVTDEGAAWVWGRNTDRPLARLYLHLGGISAAGFVVDRDEIFTAGRDLTVRYYRCEICGDYEALREAAKLRPVRTLTPEEEGQLGAWLRTFLDSPRPTIAGEALPVTVTPTARRTSTPTRAAPTPSTLPTVEATRAATVVPPLPTTQSSVSPFAKTPPVVIERSPTARGNEPKTPAAVTETATAPAPTSGTSTPTVSPEYTQPPSENPGTEQPPSENPGTEQPPSENPGTEQPPSENPGTEQPPSENPGTEQPPSEDPDTSQPLSADPDANPLTGSVSRTIGVAM